MRKRKNVTVKDYRIIVVDDEQGILDSISVMLKGSGYEFKCVDNPIEAIELVKNEKFDLMILDYLMTPIHGDKVVEKIREFNKELYILLLTGHKDLAPPLMTIKALDIQGYCEKSDRFDQLLLLIESGIKSISQMRTIKRFKDGLSTILEAVPKIYQLQPIGNILEEILAKLMPLVNSENAFILVDNTKYLSEGNKSIFRGLGKYKVNTEYFMEMLDPHFMEQIGTSRTTNEIIYVDEGIILPLINEFDQSIGVIYVESNNMEDGLKLIELYTNQAAASLNNAFLHSLVNIKNEELNNTYNQLKIGYMDTIEALRQVVDAKDVYTRGHSDRVSFYAVKLGKAFNLSKKEVETLRIGGMFHDVGKTGIMDDILLKTEKLNEYEYQEIKKHPLKGSRILSVVSMFKDVVPIVKYHHERIDGNGYPEGLKGENIPFLVKIITVVDAFDAMMSDRRYRSRLELNEAKNQLIEGIDKQFDKEIVTMFIELLNDYDSMKKEIETIYTDIVPLN